MTIANNPPPKSLPADSTTSDGNGVGRRTMLRAGMTAGAVVAGSSFLSTGPGAATAGAEAHPGDATTAAFLHGVASGDPMPDCVILWTRVTPSPDATPGSGVGAPTGVRWEVATDAGFANIVRSGTETATAERDHTVKFDCTGLAPNTWYHYRFHSAGQTSPVGRTRTTPADDATVSRLRIGLASCSHWEVGYFAGYRHLAERDDLDIVMHVGDYIYEYEPEPGSVRPHEPGHDIVSLADYRIRIGQYRTAPELQQLHAHVPWLCTWDDHEKANNDWQHGADNHDPATQGPWPERRDNSWQAYFEWMPIRPDTLRDGGMLYRKLRFGRLAEISMLDLRSYRSEEVSPFDGRAIDDPGRTMTGDAQFDWLARNFETSTSRWNVVGNSVMIMPIALPALDPEVGQVLQDLIGLPKEGLSFNADQWDGYAAQRRRLFEVMQATGENNFVFLTGDIHTHWAADLPAAPADYPGAGIVGCEFVGNSITSNNVNDALGLPEGNGVSHAAQEALKGLNHHLKMVDLDRHGYVVVELTENFAHADFFCLHERRDPATGAYRMASYRFPRDGSGMQPAGPLP